MAKTWPRSSFRRRQPQSASASDSSGAVATRAASIIPATEKPVAIDIDERVEAWLANLERDGMRVAVFQTPDDQGVSVSTERLKRDLTDELSQFEL